MTNNSQPVVITNAGKKIARYVKEPIQTNQFET